MGQFLVHLWDVLGHALRVQPDLLAYVQSLPHANWLTFAVAALAGISQLLGQSAVLLANRVSPGRFVLSLALNGLIFALDLALWSASLWLVARGFYGIEAPLGLVLRLVCLGSAPLTLGFLVLMPYLGPALGWSLRLWSFLVILSLVRGYYPLTLYQALTCTAGGWLLIEILNRTLGQPLLWLRDWLWRTVTTSHYDENIQRQVDEVTAQLRQQLPARGQPSRQN